jgi:hypothetical protein
LGANITLSTLSERPSLNARGYSSSSGDRDPSVMTLRVLKNAGNFSSS